MESKARERWWWGQMEGYPWEHIMRGTHLLSHRYPQLPWSQYSTRGYPHKGYPACPSPPRGVTLIVSYRYPANQDNPTYTTQHEGYLPGYPQVPSGLKHPQVTSSQYSIRGYPHTRGYPTVHIVRTKVILAVLTIYSLHSIGTQAILAVITIYSLQSGFTQAILTLLTICILHSVRTQLILSSNYM